MIVTSPPRQAAHLALVAYLATMGVCLVATLRPASTSLGRTHA
jgi:hypothetical protein